MAAGILFGLVFAGAGGYALWSTLHLHKIGTRVQGEIVDYATSTDGEGHISYNAVVSFMTADGEDMTAECTLGSSSRGQIGRQVPIRYDPAKPSKIEIDTVTALSAGILGGTAATAIGIGIVIYTIAHG